MAANRITSGLLLTTRNGLGSSLTRICQSKVQPPKRNVSLWLIPRRFQKQTLLRPFIAGVGASLVGAFVFNQYLPSSTTTTVSAAQSEKENKENKKGNTALSRREKRFHDFASCELHGQIVMTPYDFIESLIENQPKLSRSGKIRLTEKSIRRIAKRTPPIQQGSTTFFRDMHQDGIITYSEYLFLVTVLTKSNAGLKTALKMMDVNGDKLINVEEFQLIERMINESASCVTNGESSPDDSIPITTIYLHLFGQDGQRAVAFDEFFKFMDNLQSEVLELEFHEYSKSLRSITEVDFAKILLRNTTLTDQEHCEYMNRLKERITIPRGVDMEQFKAFNTFLSNIEDFIIAVNMTNVSGQDVDKDLFKRAVRVTTGEEIDPYIIDVVFSLFDQDGDGKLSQNEFIGIMKDRLKRGFGKFPNVKGFGGFKHCLKKEMIKSSE